jgi:IS30 family transposase
MKTDLKIISAAYLSEIENKPNNRPRKRFEYEPLIFEMNKSLFNEEVPFTT